MSGRAAFYSFSFDLGPTLDLIGLANRLLKNDMATVAGSPSRDDLRVGRRVAHTHLFHRKAEKTAKFFGTLYSGDFTLKDLWRLDRVRSLQVLWAIRGPVIRAVTHRILFGQARRTQIDGSGAASDSSEDVRESQQILSTAVTGIRDVFMDQLMLGAMRLRVEQQIYFPRYYLRIEPFIRLEMNRAYFTDDSFELEPMEISLMIHRSGICILTFATPIPKQLDAPTAHKIVLSSTRTFGEAKISMPLISARGRLPIKPAFRYRVEEEIHEGVQWLALSPGSEDGANELSLVSIFGFYLNAIERMAKTEVQTEWRCFTTLFQGKPRCACDGAEAKDIHAVDFGQLLVRSLSRYPVTDEFRRDLLRNHLVNTHAELWLAAGCAIHTYWHNEDIDYVADVEMLEPIEFAILQYCQLEAIDTRTVNVLVRDRDLFDAQNQLATSLPEYGRNLMSDVNAPRVVKGLSAQLNSEQIYSRLNDRVKVLESIVNARFARKQSRRSLAISFLGLMIVVLLLLPRIDEFLAKMALLNPTAALVVAIDDFFGGHDRAIIGIYVLAITWIIVIFAAFTFRPTRFRRHKRRFGYSTKHDVVVNRARDLSGNSDESMSSTDS